MFGWVTNKQKLSALLLIVLLIICNLTFIPTGGWARLVWNILGYLGLLGIFIYTKLSPIDVGLDKAHIKSGLKYSAFCIAIIGVVLVLFFLTDKQVFKDPRYHHNLATAFYATLILLPLKTVLFEELAFRGLFLSLMLKIKNNRWLATIISSLAFGLWHVFSSTNIGNYSIGNNIVIPGFLVTMIAVLFTSLAGVVLCELRWRSKSLIAPIVVHWFVNGSVIILAALSWH